MAYEIFSRKVLRAGTPSVTFTKTGRMALNRQAAKLITEQGTDLVLLLWDKAARTVAVRPIHKKDDSRAYKVRFGGKGNTAGFHAATFFDYIEYDCKKEGTRAFPAKWNADQGLLEVSLTGASEESQPTLLAVNSGRSRSR